MVTGYLQILINLSLGVECCTFMGMWLLMNMWLLVKLILGIKYYIFVGMWLLMNIWLFLKLSLGILYTCGNVNIDKIEFRDWILYIGEYLNMGIMGKFVFKYWN